MNWIKKIIGNKLGDWIYPELKYIFVRDFPEKLKDHIIYLVGDSKKPWLIAFYCPCGCQNVIQLNLLKDAFPCWGFRINKKRKISIYPSIWRTTGCKSHFFVRKNRIKWFTYYQPNTDEPRASNNS